MNSPLAALDARLAATRNTGDTSYWRGLIEGFSQLDEDFTLLLCSNTPRPEFIPEDPRLLWRQVPSPHSRLWSLVAFPRYAKAQGARVTHSQYTLSPLAVGPVTTIHDLSFLIGPEWFKPKDRFLMSRSVPATVGRAEAVLAVSETTKQDLERLIPASRGKITVAYNSLGSNIKPLPAAEAAERVRNLGVEGPYVLSVSTMWPRKNMSLAVNAVDLLPASLPHKLVLTGKDGWGDQTMGRRTLRVGYVSDEDLTALYQRAEAYLCPSLYEGFGIPILEAFACQCPVICSSGGSLPEIADKAGYVMESWNPSDWARELAGILVNSARQDELKELGLKRLQDFSWKETARRTLAVYRQVADRSPKSSR